MKAIDINLAESVIGSSSIDESSVQRIIVHGYNFDCLRHYLLTIHDPIGARNFLSALHDDKYSHITWANEKIVDPNNKTKVDNHATINIGFTYTGLKQLQLKDSIYRCFDELAPAFSQGAFYRAPLLGDTGSCAADFWDQQFKSQTCHCVLTIYANSYSVIDGKIADLKKFTGADAFTGWDKYLEGKHITPNRDDRREHFGFRDGIAQPVIKGIKPRKVTGNTPYATGDFLLGYKNSVDENQWASHQEAKRLSDFFYNSSFGALRQVEQNVKQFYETTDKLADAISEDDATLTSEVLRAKMVGRWPNGAPIKPEQTREPDKIPERINDFDFNDDKEGKGCPFSSHIRRINPRSDAVIPSRPRPIIRRGMPYGPAYNHENPSAPENKQPRGLLGLFICASLEEQFEFLLQDWVNRPPLGPDRHSTAKDPLVGHHESPIASIQLPTENGANIRCQGLTPFVQTRGMTYLFFPSRIALESIIASTVHFDNNPI